MIATLLSLAIILGLVYVAFLSSRYGGSPQAVNPVPTAPPVPAPGAYVAEHRKVAYETCRTAQNDWLSLAQPLGTPATSEAIARGYARYAGEPAVYEACLQGFRDK
jgi:hypothetical protein